MTESACYAEVRSLLRDIDRPHRRQERAPHARRPLATPRELVEEALEQLPPRFRTILTRCDLAKERHAAVALHLGISERHFYRERQKAIAALAEALDALPERTPALQAIDADPDATYLACARALANMGRVGDAIRLLDDALSHVQSAATRGAIAVALTELCCDAGDFDRAASYLSIGERTAESMQGADEKGRLLKLEGQTLRAALLLHNGRADRARESLERTIAELDTISTAHRLPKARATVSAHLLLVDVLDDLGAFGAALEAAFEASSAARRSGLEPALRFRAQFALTQTRVLTATPISAVLDQVAADYDFAQANGLARDCADAAALFCILYSYAGQHDRALAFGARALEIDRAVGAPDGTHRCYLASAFLRCGDAAAARAALSRVPGARTDVCSFDQVVPRLIEAEALHSERRYGDALQVARNAVASMRRIGSERGLGSALRVQAEIQDALGEKWPALRSIGQAISLLGKNGTPFALAQAYGCSARLSGNRRHRRAAQEMMRLFQFQ